MLLQCAQPHLWGSLWLVARACRMETHRHLRPQGIKTIGCFNANAVDATQPRKAVGISIIPQGRRGRDLIAKIVKHWQQPGQTRCATRRSHKDPDDIWAGQPVS